MKLETEKDFKAEQKNIDKFDKRIKVLKNKIQILHGEKKELEDRINLQRSDHYADIKGLG